MSDLQTKEEHVPTPEELEREARRLARTRYLTVVPPPQVYTTQHDGYDPDPQEAA
jgi:hypothetical protein